MADRPMTPLSDGFSSQMGGGSNTPPSASNIHLVRDNNMWALPPVMDTVYISTESEKPSKTALSWFQSADALDGDVFEVVRAGPGDAARPVLEAGQDDHRLWAVRLGKLDGFSAYRYVLDGRGHWSGVTVLCAPPKSVEKPWRWYVMVRSERLWLKGCLVGLSGYDVVRHIVNGLGQESDCGPMAGVVPLTKWRVSRVDVCRDHGGYDWQLSDLAKFATSCPVWSRGMNFGETPVDDMALQKSEGGWTYGSPGATTFYMGKRRTESKFLRIYCKNIEAEKTGKLGWMMPFWKRMLFGAAGATGDVGQVWRAEVEFGGGWCKSHGLTNATHLEGCERALWDYYVKSNRHTSGGAKKLRTCPPSQVWELLRKCPDDWLRRWHEPLKDSAWTYERAPEREPCEDMSLLRKQAAGCLAGVVAAHTDLGSDAEATRAVDAVVADIATRLHEKSVDQIVDDIFKRLMPKKNSAEADAVKEIREKLLARFHAPRPIDSASHARPERSRYERMNSQPSTVEDPFSDKPEAIP